MRAIGIILKIFLSLEMGNKTQERTPQKSTVEDLEEIDGFSMSESQVDLSGGGKLESS